MNRFESDELVAEVATWLERVATDCNVAIPFRENPDGRHSTTMGVMTGPVYKNDNEIDPDRSLIAVVIPLARLMLHCNLTESQAIEAVELAGTSPDKNIHISFEPEGPEILNGVETISEAVVHLGRIVIDEERPKYYAEMHAEFAKYGSKPR